MNRHITSILFLLPALVLIFGCDRPAVKRQYTEIFIQAPKKTGMAMTDPHSFLQGMPQDDIHANLPLSDSNMPQDDIHANLQLPGSTMPQDDIHANLQPGSMPMMPGLEQSVDRTPLSWKTPKGWLEQKGSGMRLVTFSVSDKSMPIETTIVSLGGSAGGIEGNIVRWMGQLRLAVPSAAEMAAFIKKQDVLTTESGLTATMVDLTQWQDKEKDTAASMIAAIIERPGSQTFVKMTGTKKAVLANRAKFKELVTSIAVNK